MDYFARALQETDTFEPTTSATSITLGSFNFQVFIVLTDCAVIIKRRNINRSHRIELLIYSVKSESLCRCGDTNFGLIGTCKCGKVEMEKSLSWNYKNVVIAKRSKDSYEQFELIIQYFSHLFIATRARVPSEAQATHITTNPWIWQRTLPNIQWPIIRTAIENGAHRSSITISDIAREITK